MKSIRSGASKAVFFRTCIRHRTIFEIRRLFSSSSLETDQLLSIHKRNAPQKFHPPQRHRCGRLSRPCPWLATTAVCRPPPAVGVLWRLVNFEQSAQESKCHVCAWKPANCLNVKSSELGSQDTKQGRQETRCVVMEQQANPEYDQMGVCRVHVACLSHLSERLHQLHLWVRFE